MSIISFSISVLRFVRSHRGKIWDEGRFQLPQKNKKDGKLTQPTQLLKQELMSEASDIYFLYSLSQSQITKFCELADVYGL